MCKFKLIVIYVTCARWTGATNARTSWARMLMLLRMLVSRRACAVQSAKPRTYYVMVRKQLDFYNKLPKILLFY